jgi:AcrR family transcriptional regulator
MIEFLPEGCYISLSGESASMHRKPDTGNESGDITRQKLLLAACELFATQGFGAASIREIARKAGTNVAAINYHYGSKENLYSEAVKYVVRQIMARRSAIVAEVPEGAPRKVVLEALRKAIELEVRWYVSSEAPQWHFQLILGCILTRNDILDTLFEQVFHPNHVMLKRLLCAACPEMDDRAASLWVYSIAAQIYFYAYARQPVRMELGLQEYTDEFIQSISEHISHTVVAGLPVAPARGKVKK